MNAKVIAGRAALERADLHRLVPDGDARVRAVIERWGLRWPDSA